jgi:hypothetical protein
VDSYVGFGVPSQRWFCYLLHAGFSLGLFSTLNMEATCSSETSVDFQRSTRRFIPGDRTLDSCGARWGPGVRYEHSVSTRSSAFFD